VTLGYGEWKGIIDFGVGLMKGGDWDERGVREAILKAK
jgi:hypothetical protein